MKLIKTLLEVLAISIGLIELSCEEQREMGIHLPD